jgi:hypothetical protein
VSRALTKHADNARKNKRRNLRPAHNAISPSPAL